ncbi:MAG: TRAP transporter substrate-binding protein [Acidisphaera sp.]|nr:TRAP transporter substrate-binding protein [Acidisphaera sp.]
MPLMSRRTLLAAGTALPACAILRPAHAAEFSYKYASNLPVTHPLNIRAQEAVDRIKTASSGRLEIKVFPNNQLGSDTDMLGQLRNGALEFFTLSGLILSTFVPPASINGVGFAFKDYDQVWKAMDGPVGTYVRGEIDKRGLVAFEKIWDNGFRQITTSTRPIRTPDDLAGFKIRVPVSPLWTSLFQDLGAGPTSINFSEVYSALQTRIVDGQENPLAIIETAKLYEVQKYLSMTNHMWDGYWFLANRRAFERLPKDLQDLTRTEFNRSAVEERTDVAAMNGSLGDTLKGQGMAVNQPDPAPFRDKLRKAGFYADWKAKYGEQAWSTLESVVGTLA